MYMQRYTRIYFATPSFVSRFISGSQLTSLIPILKGFAFHYTSHVHMRTNGRAIMPGLGGFYFQFLKNSFHIL